MNLRFRLLLANLLVLAVGLLTAALIGHNYKAQQFSRQIYRLEERSQFSQDQDISTETSFPFLLDSFKRINDRGTLMALASSLFGASLIRNLTKISCITFPSPPA